MQEQNKIPKQSKLVIKKVDDWTIEVALRMYIETVEVKTIFMQKNKLNYFDEIKDLVHIITEEGVEIKINGARHVIKLDAQGVSINDDEIVIENEELIYVVIRYLMLRRGYDHEAAIINLVKYQWPYGIELKLLRFAIIALNSNQDFDVVATMFDYVNNEIMFRLYEAEERCKK